MDILKFVIFWGCFGGLLGCKSILKTPAVDVFASRNECVKAREMVYMSE
jgi:hypothetical protein